MEIWYLYHSGVAVYHGGQLAVFDYWQNRTLPEGIPALARRLDCPVTVFVSHKHADHYNPEIFSWRQELPDVRYILSSDVPSQSGCQIIRPGQTLEVSGMTVTALRSTDEGVAFLCRWCGKTLYHAGDLHWWHWNGETDAYNRDMAEDYRREIDKLSDIPLDAAFVPVDGRLEDAYAMGIEYFAAHVDCPCLIPIHFTSDPAVLHQLECRSGPCRGRLCILEESRPHICL